MTGAPRRVAVLGGSAALLAAALVSVVVLSRDRQRMPAADVTSTANAAIPEEWRRCVFRPVPAWFADARIGLQAPAWVETGDAATSWEFGAAECVVQLVATSHIERADAEAVALGISEWSTLFQGERYLIRGAPLTPSARVTWDGYAALADAEVKQVRPDGSETECSTWARNAWHCGRRNDYIFVGQSTREMGDQNPHRCIMANPPEGGATWRVTFADVPTEGGTLRWRAGNTFAAVRSERGGPVSWRVSLNGEIIDERTFDIHDTSFDGQGLPLPEDMETVDLTFELSSPDHFDRFFCFRPQVIASAD